MPSVKRTYKKSNTGDVKVDKNLYSLQSQLDQIISVPLLSGRPIEDIVLSIGVDKTINHKLDRPLQGWIVTRRRAPEYSAIKTKIVAGFDGSPESDTTTWDQGGGSVITTTANTVWRNSITLDVGQRLRAVRARILDNATGTTTIQMTVERYDDGSSTSLGNPISLGNGTEQTLSVADLTETFITNSFQRRWVVAFTQSAANACRIRQLYIEYDELVNPYIYDKQDTNQNKDKTLILRSDNASPTISLWVY